MNLIGKKLPDSCGWWARKQYGEIQWYYVEEVMGENDSSAKLKIIVDDIFQYYNVELFTTPTTRWYGPIILTD